MKHCNICDQEKKISEFGKDKQKSDGLNSNCKACIRIRSAAQRKNNPKYTKEYAEKYREKNREILRKKAKEDFLKNKELRLLQGKESYYKHQHKIAIRRQEKRQSPEARKKENERQKKWRAKNKEKYRGYVKKWQITNRERHNAHQIVHRAIEKGMLIRNEICQECGSNNGKMEGHHEDYTKPLEVIWLCKLCHASKIRKL